MTAADTTTPDVRPGNPGATAPADSLEIARDRAIDATASRAKEPKAAPSARGWTYLVAVLLLALAGVAIWDILVRTNAVQGPELTTKAMDWVAAEAWMPYQLVGGIIAVIIGVLLLLFVVLKPRRATHLRAKAKSSAWLRPVDVARLVSGAARTVPGVLEVGTSASRKRIILNVRGGGATSEELRDRIVRAVEPIVTESLANPPKVEVRVTSNRTNTATKEVKA